MLQVNADYVLSGTGKSLDEQFGDDWETKGPGWYLTDTYSVLLVCNRADDETRWNQKQPADTIYTCYVWNCPFTSLIWGHNSIPPTRLDTRGE